jgi:hypothetical protein
VTLAGKNAFYDQSYKEFCTLSWALGVLLVAVEVGLLVPVKNYERKTFYRIGPHSNAAKLNKLYSQ